MGSQESSDLIHLTLGNNIADDSRSNILDPDVSLTNHRLKR